MFAILCSLYCRGLAATAAGYLAMGGGGGAAGAVTPSKGASSSLQSMANSYVSDLVGLRSSLKHSPAITHVLFSSEFLRFTTELIEK